jgi:Zn-finger nucleic acid-binding protein
MQCPRCNDSQLSETRVKGKDVRIDACPACKGLWFDGEELERVLPAAANELTAPADAAESAKNCPRCSVPLARFQYPQTLVTVDLCRECGGLWLDPGEFQEIRAVREKLKEAGELEERAPVGGTKGTLLRFINEAISSLWHG